MPRAMQAKLLRVLQEGEVVPVGDNRPRKVDVRVDLGDESRPRRRGAARSASAQDLYYRIAAFPIRLPPLASSARGSSRSPRACLAATAERYKKRITRTSTRARSTCWSAYDWPGNVRELQNEIERAGSRLARNGESIGLSAPVGEAPRRRCEPRSAVASAAAMRTRATAGRRAARMRGRPLLPFRDSPAPPSRPTSSPDLAASGGNITRAAQKMGLSRVALQKKMKEYGLR